VSPAGVRRARLATAVLGALAVALAAVAAVAFVAVGAGFQIHRSDSMSPAIDAGALVVTAPVAGRDIAAGDVVNVRVDGEPVTRRVVSAAVDGDETTLVLRADAATDADPEQHVVHAADRVVWSVPVAGYVVETVSSPVGLVGIGVLFVVVTLLTPVLPEHTPLPGGRHRSRRAILAVRSSVRPSLD
jgi:hypothetical protein